MNKLLPLLFFFSVALTKAQTIGLIQHDAGSLDDGYVLFASITSTTTYLIDKCGKQVKTWPSTYRPGQSVYILPDGTLLRTGNANNATFNAGGKGGVIEKIDWNGNLTWSYTVSDATKCQHHDVKALPNGNVLIIAWESKTNTQAIAEGRNPAAYNNGTTADKKLFGQHNATWIPSGFPFENQIIIYNNGMARPGGNYTTVEIINPPVSGYNYTATLPYLPSTTSWIYNQGNPNNYYAQNISGAQQLSNGNVLMCNGPAGTFTEVTTTGTTVWKYINPVSQSGIITQGTTPAQNLVFRCTYYPADFSGFANHTLVSGNTIENTNTLSASCSVALGLNNENLTSEILIYPNPAKDFITIQTQMTESNLKVEFVDMMGKVVKTSEMVQGSTLCVLETDTLYNGVYIIKISDAKNVTAKKVIISK